MTIPLPRRLEDIRRSFDPVARAGVPAHVTLLFPFLRTDALDRDVRGRLARIAAAHRRFAVEFASVGRFPGILYLEPAPSAPFRAMTGDIVAAFPACLPYGGSVSVDEVVPHLTLAVAPDDVLTQVASEAATSLPVRAVVRYLTVMRESHDERWSRHWRLALAATAQTTPARRSAAASSSS